MFEESKDVFVFLVGQLLSQSLYVPQKGFDGRNLRRVSELSHGSFTLVTVTDQLLHRINEGAQLVVCGGLSLSQSLSQLVNARVRLFDAVRQRKAYIHKLPNPSSVGFHGAVNSEDRRIVLPDRRVVRRDRLIMSLNGRLVLGLHVQNKTHGVFNVHASHHTFFARESSRQAPARQSADFK